MVLISSSSISQNILQALELKTNLIGKYYEGETMSTDTIIDLGNGYYEEYASYGDDDKIITRQAALFKNEDGTKLLGISTTAWDFQCYMYETKLYEIAQSGDTLSEKTTATLPYLSFREFITDEKVIPIIEKYLPEIQNNYLDSTANVDQVLSEIYDMVYILPQHGKNIKAALGVCDYIPTNEVNISSEDWEVIENGFGVIDLIYDKKLKKFQSRNKD